jgi:single-strand DNA-binding protein
MINCVAVSGRIVDTPEVKEFKDKKGKGRFVSYFRIANSVSKDNANFFEVVCFNSVGKHLNKGQEVVVHGRLEQNRFEKDGKKYSRVQIIASELVMGKEAFNQEN